MFDLRSNGIDKRRRDVASGTEDAFCQNCLISVKAATEQRTWTRCRWQLHERPATRRLVQQLACANIHIGSPADKTRVSSNSLDHSCTRCIAPQSSAASSCLHCKTSSRLRIAHRTTATRPMDHRDKKTMYGDANCQMVESCPDDKDNEQLWRRAHMDHNSKRD